MTKKAAVIEREVHAQEMDTLQDAAVLFSLRIGQWRIRKNADRSRVETTAQRRLVNVRKRILDSDEYRAIVAMDTEARDFVLRQSLPSPLGRGVYLLPIALVRGTMEWLKSYQATRDAAIEKFLAVYPAQKGEMQKALGDMYDETDYPSIEAVRGRFWVATLMMELNAPSNLEAISATMYEEEVRRLRNVWDETRETISAALYDEMSELVDGLASRLETKEVGKDPVLRDSVVDKFQEWLDVFEARNLTKDERLGTLVERARDLVSGVSAKSIRENKKFRVELAEQFKGLRGQLAAAVVERPRRKIRLGDDE